MLISLSDCSSHKIINGDHIIFFVLYLLNGKKNIVPLLGKFIPLIILLDFFRIEKKYIYSHVSFND